MAEESESSAVCSSAENWWNGVSTGSGSGSGSGSCSSLMFNILEQPHASETLNWSSCTSTSIPTCATEEVDNLSSTITSSNNNHTTTSSTLSTMDSGGLSQQELVDSASLLEQHMNMNMGHFNTPHAHNPNIWSQVLLCGGGGARGSSDAMRGSNNFEEAFYSKALRQEIGDPEHLKKIQEDVPTGWELRNQIAAVAPFDMNMNLKTHIPTPSGFLYDSNATTLPDLGTWPSSDLNMAQFDVGRIKKEYPLPSSLGVSLTSTQLLQGYGGDSNFKNDSSFSHILESRPFVKSMGEEYANRWPSNSSGCLSQSLPSSCSKAGVLNFGNMSKQVLDFSKSDLMKKQNDRSIQFYHDGKQAHTLPSQHRTMPHGDEARDSTTDTKRSRCTDQTTGDTIFKRPRLENSSTVPAFKVRKEKLGDRITALQQLVAPFGKTDTASVLMEAIGYIKFLQEQVKVLSTPYMKSGGPISSQGVQDQKGRVSSDKKDTDEPKQDLRSRGLCLVPVSCTLHVANDNGADYWTPTIGGTYR